MLVQGKRVESDRTFVALHNLCFLLQENVLDVGRTTSFLKGWSLLITGEYLS